MARQIIEMVLLGVDRQRFPWLSENRDLSEAECHAAVIATAALLAQRAVMTNWANESKEEQEQAVKDRLVEAGFAEAPRRAIPQHVRGPCYRDVLW